MSSFYFKRSDLDEVEIDTRMISHFSRPRQDKENRVAIDRRRGGEIIRPDPNCAGKPGPAGDEGPFRGQDRPSPRRGVGFPEAVRQRQRDDEFLQQEQSAVNRMGGQRRWTRLVDVGQRRGKRAAPGLLQKLRRPSTNGCPFYGVLGPGADHERNQLKRRVDDLEKKNRETFEGRRIGEAISRVRLNMLDLDN